MIGERKMHQRIECGFTLIESLIATLILGIGALALAQVLALGVTMNVRTKDNTELTTIATKYLESIYQVSYRNLIVGGDLNPAPGSENPAYCALDVHPESRVPNSDDFHRSMATYDVYWQISNGAGTVAGAPFKVISVRVLSKRMENKASFSREMTMSVQVLNQFAI